MGPKHTDYGDYYLWQTVGDATPHPNCRCSLSYAPTEHPDLTEMGDQFYVRLLAIEGAHQAKIRKAH